MKNKKSVVAASATTLALMAVSISLIVIGQALRGMKDNAQHNQLDGYGIALLILGGSLPLASLLHAGAVASFFTAKKPAPQVAGAELPMLSVETMPEQTIEVVPVVAAAPIEPAVHLEPSNHSAFSRVARRTRQ